jgi:hypothetical protein
VRRDWTRFWFWLEVKLDDTGAERLPAFAIQQKPFSVIAPHPQIAIIIEHLLARVLNHPLCGFKYVHHSPTFSSSTR